MGGTEKDMVIQPGKGKAARVWRTSLSGELIIPLVLGGKNQGESRVIWGGTASTLGWVVFAEAYGSLGRRKVSLFGSRPGVGKENRHHG